MPCTRVFMQTSHPDFDGSMSVLLSRVPKDFQILCHIFDHTLDTSLCAAHQLEHVAHRPNLSGHQNQSGENQLEQICFAWEPTGTNFNWQFRDSWINGSSQTWINSLTLNTMKAQRNASWLRQAASRPPGVVGQNSAQTGVQGQNSAHKLKPQGFGRRCQLTWAKQHRFAVLFS